MMKIMSLNTQRRASGKSAFDKLKIPKILRFLLKGANFQRSFSFCIFCQKTSTSGLTRFVFGADFLLRFGPQLLPYRIYECDSAMRRQQGARQ